MSITSIALHLAAPVPRIEDFDRFLFIGPHPDDIEIGAGATAAKLARAGKKLCFLICTDGCFGSGFPAGTDPETVAVHRRREAEHSAALLGVQDLRFLDLSDGGFYSSDDLTRGIAQAIGDFQPELIFAPDPRTISECHTDHLNVGETAMRLACFAPYGGIMAGYGAKAAQVQTLALYMTAHPNRYVSVRGLLELQHRAIFDCHASQFPDGSPERRSLELYLKLRAADFGLRSLSGCAEGFRVLGSTHMHCVPEAGL